ncbi:dethiobiotin synthase [Pyruvatibacter mobilis]|uniref:dethiobiotin synthase n=1 Tax=Pyruvatibacter mobilis TaxID=1712261 RepID=UPI003C7DAC5C
MTALSLFVTASGTEIGKTYVSTGLIRALRARGREVTALKPLITDFTDETAPTSDTALMLEALGREVTGEAMAELSPWRYVAALAPDMAAAREGKAVPYDEVIAFCARHRDAAEDGTVLIVEGAGGVLVPVDDTHTMRDFMKDLAATPILVVGSYLGTISHTLTALEALQSRGLDPLAIMVSETPDAGIPLQDTCDAIRRFTGDVPVIAVPRDDQDALARLADLVPA